MKTGLLMSVAGVAVGVAVGGMVVGAADVRAACTTTPNCESMGYKYCAQNARAAASPARLIAPNAFVFRLSLTA